MSAANVQAATSLNQLSGKKESKNISANPFVWLCFVVLLLFFFFFDILLTFTD